MGQTNPNLDRRRFERETCRLRVDIDDYEYAYAGQVFNLGLGGARIKISDDTRFHAGQEIFLTIPYHHKADYLIIKGKIAWQSEKDLGVEFLKEPFVQ